MYFLALYGLYKVVFIKKIHIFVYKWHSLVPKCMKFEDFTMYTWDFAQFVLAHEYWVTSVVLIMPLWFFSKWCPYVLDHTTNRKVSDVQYSKVIYAISFKHTASAADTLTCLHINFENNQLSLNVEMRCF